MTRQQFIDMVCQEQESLRRFLLGLCGGDAFRADDLAQEALLKAYISFWKFEGRAKFSTWLFRIAYNCWTDHMKVWSKYRACSLEADTSVHREAYGVEDTRTAADRGYEYQYLYHAISCLSPHEQVVVLLYYMEEKSIREISEISGMPSGTVRSHLSRARRRLKDYLEKHKIR